MKTFPLFLLLLAGSARADDGMAGHYYLNGVREVGSELLLGEDGRFQWYLSYGAMDQRAEGRWQQQDGHLTLLADVPAAGQLWAHLKGSRDWDEVADYAWRNYAYAASMEALDARCPFLRGTELDADSTVAVAALAAEPAQENVAKSTNEDVVKSTDENTDHDLATLDEAIAAQEARLAGFVQRAEAAAASAMAASGSERGPAMRAAAQAMSEYWAEQYALKDLYWQRSGPIPAYVKLKLPPQCTAPAEPPRESKPADWTPRGAVQVRDDDLGAYFNDVPVTLLYADGRGESLITQSGGYAFAARAGGAMPVTVRIGGEEQVQAGFPVLDLPVPADARRVLQIELDTQAMAGPAFETMELHIDGRELIPIWPGGREQGRYSRD